MSYEESMPPLDFDFGNWCAACDKAIPLRVDAAVEGDDESKSGSKSKRGAGTTARKSIESNGTGALRRRSTTKLHHAGGGGAAAAGPSKSVTWRNKSHTSLASLGLAASTALSQPKVSTADMGESAVFDPPSSLYCSEECERLDEMRSRLAIVQLEASFSLVGKRSAVAASAVGETNGSSSSSMMRRKSSRTSQSSMTNPPINYFQSPPATTSNLSSSATASDLVRPPLTPTSHTDCSLSRGGSEQDTRSPHRSVRSDDDSDHAISRKSYRSTSDSPTSPPSSSASYPRTSSSHGRTSTLSALRFLTPISTSPPFSGITCSNPSTSSAFHLQPPPLLRSSTDFTIPTLSSKVVDSSSGHNGNDQSSKADGKGMKRVKVLTPEREIADRLEMPPPALSLRLAPPDSPSYSNSRRPQKSASSASLALMNSSFSNRKRSSDVLSSSVGSGWKPPRRTESTASLTGLVAIGSFVLGPDGHDEMVSSTPIVRKSTAAFDEREGRSVAVQSASSHSPDSSLSLSSSAINSSSVSRRRRPPSTSHSQCSLSPPSTFQLSPKLPSHRSRSRGASTGSGATKIRQELLMTPSDSLHNSSSAISTSASPDGSTLAPSSERRTSSLRRRSRRANSRAEDEPVVVVETGHFLDHVLASDIYRSTGIGAGDDGAGSGRMARKSFSNRRKSRGEDADRRSGSTSRAAVRAQLLAGSASSSRLLGLNSTATAATTSWSYDHLPTYPALDLDRSSASGTNNSSRIPRIVSTNATDPTAASVAGGVGGVVKKKKLFYFDDAGEY